MSEAGSSGCRLIMGRPHTAGRRYLWPAASMTPAPAPRPVAPGAVPARAGGRRLRGAVLRAACASRCCASTIAELRWAFSGALWLNTPHPCSLCHPAPLPSPNTLSRTHTNHPPPPAHSPHRMPLSRSLTLCQCQSATLFLPLSVVFPSLSDT